MEATLMKILGVISTTALLLLFGAAVPAYAQDDHKDQDAKPEKQEQAKPAKPEEKAQPAKQEEAAKPAKQEEQAKAPKQEEQAKPVKQEEKAKPEKQQEQAKAEKQPKQTEQAKQETKGNTGGQQHAQRTAAEEQKQRSVPALRLSVRSESRIPDDRFRANFGRGHEFRIGSPTLVGGYSRFQYGGFWFGFVQPWPDGWYYTDDVYVDFIDGGYYLCNPYYPSQQVSISVVI
jgi:glucan-binding YG repeat protein